MAATGIALLTPYLATAGIGWLYYRGASAAISAVSHGSRGGRWRGCCCWRWRRPG
ncbi:MULTISPECIES: hypothetical protein [Xanthomonas translucens group]|uniref:hypothetical protein n=1 Tax=Xanthomonas translucens group TaxID=3390202 RepID=UPI000B05D15C|nr:hypothetical protein [Xanthomonas translucens]